MTVACHAWGHQVCQGGGVFWRHRRFVAREQVFDSEYLEAGELPERRVEHATAAARSPLAIAKRKGLKMHLGRVRATSNENATRTH